ncbi:MAG: hypothetical protein WCI89_03850 [bacterium]
MFKKVFGHWVAKAIYVALTVGAIAFFSGRWTADGGISQEEARNLVATSEAAAAAKLATVQSALEKANRDLAAANQRWEGRRVPDADAAAKLVAAEAALDDANKKLADANQRLAALAAAPTPTLTPAPAVVVATPTPAPVVVTPASAPIFAAPHDSVWMAAHGWRWVAVVVDGRSGKSWYCDPPKGKQTDGSCS